MALLNRRHAAGSPFGIVEAGSKLVLHVGCGPPDVGGPAQVPAHFRGPGWRELRFDIDPDVKPDIVGSIVNMTMIPRASVDAVWSCHNLEHVYTHEVPVVLREFNRVLRPGGQLALLVPDIQAAAEVIAKGNLEGKYYSAGVGDISALDVVFGFGSAIARGNEFMAHRTAFTRETLSQKLRNASFDDVDVRRQPVALLAASARKPS